jgi:Tol biopolymer transport system component
MGEVYRARDPRLNREVAIKVLPADCLTDEGRRRRFVQEAQAASALNHPHIITIHEIEAAEGRDFMVMDALIPRQGMRLNEILRIAIPIADALATAHARGIIHRDLKPANVIVGTKGAVKVLDFGLAKLPGDSAASDAETPTVTAHALLSAPGTIAGTAAYMSPEQATGGTVDARSDIFSFGAMLYEMVTGLRPFAATSAADTLNAVIHAQPKPPTTVATGIPAELERIILRCLRKDPERRFQHIDDVKVALAELKEESESGPLGASTTTRPTSRRRLAWVSAIVTVAAVAAVSVWWLRRSSPPQEPAPRSVPLTTFTGRESMPTFSPDGKQVAFVWNGEAQDNADIYVTLIGSGPPLRLTNDPAYEFSPAWSPNGDTIAFFRGQGEKDELRLVPALGGPERKLADIPLDRGDPNPNSWTAPYVTWSPDGAWIVFCPGEFLGVVALSMRTREQHKLTFPPKGWHDSGVALSPDGRALAFVRATNTESHLYVLTVSRDLRSAGEPRRLPFRPGAGFVGAPAWTADGREIVFSFFEGGVPKGLWRVAESGTREPERVALVGDNSDLPAIAQQGRRLAYAAQVFDSNLWRVRLVDGLPTGQPTRLIASTMTDSNAQYSPDGKKVAFASTRSGRMEIWMCDADGANSVPVTSLGTYSGTPRWSPNSQRIVFDSNAGGRYQIFVVDASGGVPRQLTDTPTNEATPSFSWDGKRIYFSSLRTGQWEVWSMAADGGQPAQVTKTGGFAPLESADGRVYYQKFQGVSDVWTVRVGGGDETRVIESVGQRQFAVAADGIYCIRVTEQGRRLQFFDFASGKLRDLAPVDHPTGLGLTVSPDGRSLMYTQLDQVGSDLMLIENFK